MPVLVGPSTLESYEQFSALVKRQCTLVSRSQTLSWRSTPQLASFPAMFPGSPGTYPRLHDFNVRVPVRGSLGTRLPFNGVWPVSLVPRLTGFQAPRTRTLKLRTVLKFLQLQER